MELLDAVRAKWLGEVVLGEPGCAVDEVRLLGENECGSLPDIAVCRFQMTGFDPYGR